MKAKCWSFGEIRNTGDKTGLARVNYAAILFPQAGPTQNTLCHQARQKRGYNVFS